MYLLNLLFPLVFLAFFIPFGRAEENEHFLPNAAATKDVVQPGMTLKPGIIVIVLMCRYPAQIKRDEGITSDTKSDDCYVARTYKGFSADLDGRLKQGDRITFVYRVKIDDMSFDEVTRLISGSVGTIVNIQVEGRYHPIQLERQSP